MENNPDSHTEFAKELGLTEAVSIAVGAMIGGGIFGVLGRLSKIAGPAAMVSFLLGGIIAFLTANSYYKLIAKYPSSGGEFTILRQGFPNKPLFGNILGALLWLGYSVTIALYAFVFGLYTSEEIFNSTGIAFFNTSNPALFTGRKLMSFLSILIFMLINLKGVKETGLIQNVIVAYKSAVLLGIGFLGLYLFNPNHYIPFTKDFNPFTHEPTGALGGWGAMVIGSAVIFVSYEGFQVIANAVEEMKNPTIDVRKGMYISIISVTFIYIFVTFATITLVNPILLEKDETALISAVKVLGAWATFAVAIGAAASTTSAINATLLGSSRLAYVMSDYSAFPKRLAVISKSKVPYMAIIITSTISWIFTFFGDAREIAEVGSILFLGIYFCVNFAATRIFRKDNNTIAYTAIALISLYMVLVVTYFATHIQESRVALVVLSVFLVVSFGYMLINHKVNKHAVIDESKYIKEPLGKELIREFTATGSSSDAFFIDLEQMLVPVSGQKFEAMHWTLSAQMARKYNVKVTLLHIGTELDGISHVTEVFDKYDVKYDVVLRSGKNIAQEIIAVYKEGNYQLVTLGTRRRHGIISRIMNTSVSREVVDNVDSAVLQVHPHKTNGGNVDINSIFLLFDGTERDYYLTRLTRIIASVGDPKKILAYHVVSIPQTISLTDVAEFPEIQRSQREFESYTKTIGQQYNLDIAPVLLYGHNFVKALVEATDKHKPEVVIIGHTKDEGLWNRIRKRLAYRIMQKVHAAVLVYHMPYKQY